MQYSCVESLSSLQKLTKHAFWNLSSVFSGHLAAGILPGLPNTFCDKQLWIKGKRKVGQGYLWITCSETPGKVGKPCVILVGTYHTFKSKPIFFRILKKNWALQIVTKTPISCGRHNLNESF